MRMSSFSVFLGLCLSLLLCMSESWAMKTAYRASILHFLDDPDTSVKAYEYFEDGILVVEDGKVSEVGEANALLASLQGTDIQDFSGKLIIPGFIDTHIHYPQTEMIAAHGEALLEWLENYTFPTEKKFSDREYGLKVSDFFLDQLVANGTTTALVFGTVFPQSVDALFERAEARNMRLIAGKVLMDRNAPDYLKDTPESGFAESKTLIDKWHNKGRLSYAVTPRFAPTSSEEQLKSAKALLDLSDDLYMQTHVSENVNEVAWVKSLFPQAKSYLDVYDSFGLITPRAMFAHGIYLSDQDMQTLARNSAAISFCPTSNLFLGSGLFPLHKAGEHKVNVSLGTDVGAGTSFSMFHTMNEAYKVIQLQKSMQANPDVKPLSSLKAFYLATLGGARSLKLEDKIGNFARGKEADFILLNPNATELLAFRNKQVKSLEEQLFVMQMLGDDRLVEKVYLMGRAQ